MGSSGTSRSRKPRRSRAGKRLTRNRIPRPSFDREYLRAFLKENGSQTSRQLTRSRKPSEPAVYDYRKEWGSWQHAVDSIWGILPALPVTYDREYMAKLLVENNVWTQEAYMKKRKESPHVYPSYYHIRKRKDLWGGTWGGLKRFAEKYSTDRMFRKYVVLSRRLGRKPTYEEGRQSGIDMDKLKSACGGKRELDELLGLRGKKRAK